ncbi:hypothetical protein K438DRAFT_1798470 [Mycena galopus ATCC 62051]|nr:hypothetical protein K438DRAFT_1798470 [Mycena galopus ATCC 62051]
MGLWLALHLSTIQPPDPACHIAPAAPTPEVTLALAQRPQSDQAAPRATGGERERTKAMKIRTCRGQTLRPLE